MTSPEQQTDLVRTAEALGLHHARQHFANHLSTAGETLLGEMAEVELELLGQNENGKEMKQAVDRLRVAFREEWERLYARAMSGR